MAEVAGVSQSTVSRALRGDGAISNETRERVASAALQLGYRPDVRAIRLRGGMVGYVAVVLLYAGSGSRRSLNPFYFDIASAVEAAAARRGMSVLLSMQGDAASLRSDFESRREADGVVVIGTAANTAAWDHFARAGGQGSNIVAWGAPDDSLPCVRADNVAAGRLAVDHLLGEGRRAIAFVGPGWQSHLSFAQRRHGYLAAMAGAGLAPVEAGVAPCGDRVREGEEAVAELLACGVSFDAVFAATDALAAGAMRGLARAGLSVPTHVSVVGFDGGQGAQMCDPLLTTVAQDVVAAGEMLLATLFDGERKEGVRGADDVVPVHLVVRESSALR
ncbi:MAG TPA: LacI family DNA-binding transcriptional regulator [Sphingomonas sp.]